VLAPVLASLALVCQGQLAPPTKEQQRQAALEDYAEQRASFGFRSDIPYVKELIRRGVWEYDVGYIPVTPAENRYLRLRDRLDLGGRAYRYLRKRRDLSGGLSVEDDWPRGPYLLLRLTRNRAAHEANLKRLVRFPKNLRTVEVRYSERQLRRFANRIDPDLRKLDREGFYVSGWGPDITANTVEVELITARTDHAEYFRRRYGPAVTTKVIATERTREECADAERYEISPGGDSLVMHWGDSGDAEPDHVEVTEYADRVEIGVVQRLPNGGQTADLVPYTIRAQLSAPLGDRPVIDAADGRRLRQLGPSPGEPPCPADPPQPSELESAISYRKEIGLPHGRAYVRRMLRRRYPYTKAEEAYRDARFEIEYDRRALAYFERHRDEFGGAVVRGRFPGEPYLVVHFTRRLAFHRRSLERIVRARVVRARYTMAELRRLENRIEPGFAGGWGDAGFLVMGALVEPGRVVVLVITAREDAAAYFRERYGPAVRVRVVGTRHECDPPGF
jgi:hypothetical protein